MLHVMMRKKLTVCNNKLYNLEHIYVNMNIAYMLNYTALCLEFFLSRALGCFLSHRILCYEHVNYNIIKIHI